MVSDIRMDAWRAFLEAHAHVIRLLEADLEAEKALPLTWYDVLVHLEEADNHRLRMTELADRVLLSKSGLTRLVDRMCESGLVSRSADDKDKRGRWVSLEPAGLHRLHDAAPVHMRGIQEYFSDRLSDSEAVAIAGPLRRIAEMARERNA
ncbi:MAG: MarR family transcriptional regulator [Chloroflexi bacterium]|nr:MarR family transcriptional regulator [Dehalococcoidia bacterium]MCO5203334.1 MarR family transcriptional regulator [Chloroflexota bacterium]MCZ7577274.1 MarR family transcriptional regulator [Dehalococcoidia bacterium]NJD66347.1 MarR family transcriptional regulator [Chloroflexota bacterium]